MYKICQYKDSQSSEDGSTANFQNVVYMHFKVKGKGKLVPVL